MDRTHTPAPYWLLCTLFVVALYNVLALPKLNGQTPTQVMKGYVPDISPYLKHRWWEPVYYLESDQRHFPSSGKERLGRWVGPAEDSGDIMTFKIIDVETGKLVVHSVTRSALDPTSVNLRAEFALLLTVEGEEDAEMDTFGLTDPKPQARGRLQATSELIPAAENPLETRIPNFSPDEMVGLHFLKQQEDGTMIGAKVKQKTNDLEAQNHQNIKMLVKVGDEDGYEEIMSYVDLCDVVEGQHKQESENPNAQFMFQDIIGHEGPLSKDHKDYNGSMWNLRVMWQDGSITTEPLNMVAADDPISCTKYAIKHDLLEQPG